MKKNRKSQQGVTQREIAEALSLSQSTVTVALSEGAKGRVAADTVARIRDYAARNGYRPNRAAQIMRSGRSHTIAVICQSGASGYHAPQERVKHLARAALRAGYQLISIDVNWFEGNVSAAHDYLLGVAVEGIIFCNIASHQEAGWREFAQERSLPFVSMSSAMHEMDHARPDMRSAFRAMTLHHLEQGSRTLELMLSFHDRMTVEKLRGSSLDERVGGFVEAVRSMGGEVIAGPDTAPFFDLPTEFSSSRPAIQARVNYPLRTELYEDVFDLGYHETRRLLQAGKIESLICSNDHIAAGAAAACSEMGLRIPEEIRISGADNAPFSRYCAAPLTTIEQPAQSLAEWSIRRIVELIENPEERNSPKTELFPCELILRRSTTRLSPDDFEGGLDQ